jgi:SAM-dependent methyltransferase
MARILELGSGMKPWADPNHEIVHLDRLPLPHVETVWDLNLGLPYPDASFDTILAFDVIEHIIDAYALMEEIYRVLKPGGELWIRTTNWRYSNAFRDLSHYHFCDIETFDVFDPSTPYGVRYGWMTRARFKVLEKGESGMELKFKLRKL